MSLFHVKEFRLKERIAKSVGALLVVVLALAVACSEATVVSPSGLSNSGPGGHAPVLSAPTIASPGDDEQLGTLRPTMSVQNVTSNRSGTRTYEFQVSDSTAFTNIVASRTGVAEDVTGRTSATVSADLQLSTRYYWRARAAQGDVTSAWSTTGRFRTRSAAYNLPGELWDPLTGATVGTAVGSTTFVSGEGLKINDLNSYVRYDLPQTMSAGEFSMEVKGLYPNGPAEKMKVFSMFDGTGNLTNTRFEMSAQYRGLSGNPNNCISFKAVWGDLNIRLEPDLAKRNGSVINLNPAQWYYWQASWTSSSFRLVVRDGGITGAVLYDYSRNAPAGSGPYAPTPHYAYLGATSGPYGIDTGSWPGVTYRNVWLSNKPRPASLGSALRPEP